MSVAIYWFRRDLRLTDNTALAAAVAAHQQVVPVYILSEWKGEHPWTGPARQDFLCGSLAKLAENLTKVGGTLIVRKGNDQAAVLETLVKETSATAIYYNRDPDPFGRDMETRVRQMAERAGVEVHAAKDVGLHERDEVLSGSGKPYKVFGAYSRAWAKLDKPRPGGRLRRLTTPAGVRSLPLPTLKTWGVTSHVEIVEPGEDAARKRLELFLKKAVHAYSEQRNIPSASGSSRISQDLRWGLLSIREVFWRCRELAEGAPPEVRENIDRYVNELAWRDFALSVLWFHPEVLEVEFLEQFRGLRWHEPGAALERWKSGETGFPIVDAGIRQLLATGFMHNRVRMIVAMFLCKDLHHSWKEGERFFMHHLVDGEIASNNGGWQWCASVGTDAQPYFRIQNPWSQTARHDPQGEYIKKWIPELRDVPAANLAKPPKAGEHLHAKYPTPIVDHSKERDVALEMYRGHRARERERR